MKFIIPTLLLSAMVAQPALAEGSYSLRRFVAKEICSKLYAGKTVEGAAALVFMKYYNNIVSEGVTDWEQYGRKVGHEVFNICPSAATRAVKAANRYSF